MKIAVRYTSRGGNTKKIADAIAGAAGVRAETSQVPLDSAVDLLFLGGAVYAGGIDPALRSFIQTLAPEQVAWVAVFSTAAVKQSAYPEIRRLVQAQGIPVADEEFHCRGQFTLMHRGRPNEEDMRNAADFAAKLAREQSPSKGEGQ